MKTILISLTLLCFAMLTPTVSAQYPPGNYCPPGYQMPGQRPPVMQTLLFLRLAGPDGMKITFYRGMGQATTLETPCTVGLRPGYIYRIALSDMKKYPGQIFYPTLEVRGSIMLGGTLRACDFPAGLVFRDFDFNAASVGALIKKVVFLERVADSSPESSPPDNPFEIIVDRPRDPLSEARSRGLPVLTMEMGQRQEREADLIAKGIPGTILLAGEPYLPYPPRHPCTPWMCYPMYDPLLGNDPRIYYSLPDGGDWGPPAGFNADGKLVGVDPSDTVADFVRGDGQRQITPSNRVYLCIPRFLIARSPEEGIPLLQTASIYSQQVALNALSPAVRYSSQHAAIDKQIQAAVAAETNQKASATDNVTSTSVTGRIDNLDIKSNVYILRDETGNPTPPGKALPLGPQEGPEVANPLCVIKWPDKCGAMVGDYVTFFIRYTNQGRRPITNVVVTDNLITRFKYKEGSAKTDREANFTIQPNDVGSDVLRWEFTDTLRVGESGMVSFQVRIQ